MNILARTVAWTALAGLVWLAFGSVARARVVRRETQPLRLPERVEVWEGEGGQNQMAGLP